LLAHENPQRPALIFTTDGGREEVTTRSQLDSQSNQLARLLEARGVSRGSLLALALPNCPEHLLATIAGWKVGACVLPLNPQSPLQELRDILTLASPSLVIGESDSIEFADQVPCLSRAELASFELLPDDELPDVVPWPGKATLSGGSSGRPKIVVDPNPWIKKPGSPHGERGRMAGLRPGQTQLVTTRLHHAMPFNWTHAGLFEGHTIILMENFNPFLALELIERHRVDWMQLVPIVMKRLADASDQQPTDLSSLGTVLHAGAPCPPWLKHWWIDQLGAKAVWEYYSSTENIGLTMIRGDEWLIRPGSVGRPVGCDLRILSEEGIRLAAGEIGDIFTRPHSPDPTYEYLGSPPVKETRDGFLSIGDIGWVDEDNYLFISDRRTDLIVTGGVNVYPAEVEAVLSEHPSVSDLAVVPIRDQEWGHRVHAIIEPKNSAIPPTIEELSAFCRERLAPHKVPKTYEFVRKLPREPTGKIRRSALTQHEETDTPTVSASE